MRNVYKGTRHIGTQGCVSYMFDEKDGIVAKEDYEGDADDELMMQALDAGARIFPRRKTATRSLQRRTIFEDVRRALEDAEYSMAEASVPCFPQNYVELTAGGEI